MNVYIWTDSPPYTFEYDFRGKTTTQLTNDGWTLWSWYTCDSGWLYVSNNWNAMCTHNIESIKNANKITLESTYKTSTWYWHSLYCNNDSYTSTNFWIWCNQSSIRWNVEAGSIASVSASLSNVWVISVKLILDIKNWTWNYNVGSYSKSGTLTLPWSSYNNNYIWLKANIDSWSPRCQTIKLIVE